jgi:thiamine biosynthesis lipoprotein
MAEIARLEAVFSLYLPGSELVRLNATGVLDDPPFELLECLSVASAVHHASGGVFDPTVQPLWRAHAAAAEQGRTLSSEERATALARTGWGGVTLGADRISLRPGMALTLNGIAQGYIADRVAALLVAEGLTDSLIDTGEMVAIGGRPEGGPWQVTLPRESKIGLKSRALATSAPLGMTFGNDALSSHILDPRTGFPALPEWQAISISAPTAAVADAVSTAACLMKVKAQITELCDNLGDVRIESAISF